MAQKNNWQQYKDIIERNNIKCLYHFTDRENLESIINNGGLYSWADCKAKGIDIPNQSQGVVCSRGNLTLATIFRIM